MTNTPQAPRLYIVLFTADRPDYALRTLHAALGNIQYPAPISVHIADDGSPDGQREMLAECAGGYPDVRGVTVTNAEGGGYGRSYNLAMQVVHQFADVILAVEDDWELTRPLALLPYATALTEEPAPPFGCIRMGYIGYTQELRATLLFHAPSGEHYLALDPESPEPHVWAGHPRLESVAWQREVGPWPEEGADGAYLDAGTTEFIVAHRKAARTGVVWPADLVGPRGGLWEHFGSVQARGDQVKA